MTIKCDACGLCKQDGLNTVRVGGVGKHNSPIMVVLGRSTREDDRAGKAFQGSAPRFFSNVLKSAAINPEHCYFTNTVKCVQLTEDKDLTKASLEACVNKWLKLEVNLVKPKIIIALGNDAYAALTGKKSVIKDRGSLTLYEGEGFQAYVLPTYSPFYLMQAPNNSRLVNQCVTDLRKVNSIISGKFGFWSDDMLTNGELDYTTIDSVTKLQELVQKVYNSGVLACDIEARKNDAYRVYSLCQGVGFPLVSLQFATSEREAYFLPWANQEYVTPENPFGFAFSDADREEIISILRPILEDPDDKITLIGHNFKFDAKWINTYLGIRPKLDYDTMLASSFLGEASNRLKKLSWSYTSMGGYEHAQDEYTKSLPGPDQWDMFKYPVSVLVPYGCADADATLRIYNRFVADGVVNKTNSFIFNAIISASNVFTDIEHEGIHVDKGYLDTLAIDLELEMRKYEEEFRMMAPIDIDFLDRDIYNEALGKKGKPLKHKNTHFLISSNDHISRLFFGRMGMPIDDKRRSKKTKEASTSEKALKSLAPQYPIVSKLLDWRRVSKQKSGFVDAYPGFLDENNRIHPDYKLVQYEDSESGDSSGTVTGRMACIEENQLVTLLNEERPIKDVKVGDLVYSYSNNLPVLKPVLKVMDNGYQDCVKIIWESQGTYDVNSLVCTPDHLLLTKHGWRRADSLNEGEVILHLRRRLQNNGRIRVYGANSHCDSEEAIVKKTYFKADSHMHIHHINHIKDDNRLVNFQILTNEEHARYHQRLRAENGEIKYAHLVTDDVKASRDKVNYGAFNGRYVAKTKYQLLRMLAQTKGTITDVCMDFSTFKSKCSEHGIDLKQVIKRYSSFGYISRGRIISAYTKHFSVFSSVTSLAVSKELHVGIQRLKELCSFYDVVYNHRVLSVSKVGKRHVYDLEVQDTHNFIASELCVHNCSDPNLQNVPSRGEGTRIKRLFIPDFPEHLLADCDFAGIELRVATMWSQDPNMVHYFNHGTGDFHTYSAAMINGCKESEVTKAQRTLAKTFNFCILFGGSANKVSEITGVSIPEAERFIVEYFKIFPGLAKWIKSQHRFVKQNGFVTSMFGRIRHLPDATIVPRSHEERNKVEAALRRAVNSPIQADASDLTVWSLSRIWKYLNEFPHTDPTKPSRLRGSVHDSILLSVHVEDVAEILGHIKFEILENPCIDFIEAKGITLRADVSVGPNWGDQTDIAFD